MNSDQVLLQHEYAMRACAEAVANAAGVMRLTLPVLWGMKELRAHYPALSESQITALLARHCGYTGGRGKRVAVHIDHVVKLDAILRAQVA